MSRRKYFVLRTVALFLAFTILFEIIYPSAAYALTSGPTTPEVYSHQPADATDNVSLVTGGFNYTVPITSIPEYPMAIGYSSQNGMDQDATIFGFGINGFSGAIARNLQGLPDDVLSQRNLADNLKGGMHYQYSNQSNWSASVRVGVSAGLPFGEDIGVSPSASFSLLTGYDNYKGMFGAVDVGAGLDVKVPGVKIKRLPVSVGVGFGLNSSYGFYGQVGLSYNNFHLDATGQSVSLSYGSGWKSAGITVLDNGNDADGKVDFRIDAFMNSMMLTGINNFSQQNHTTSSLLSPLSSVIATTKGFGISLTIPIPVSPVTTVSVTGAYNSFDYGSMDEVKNAYGFLYQKDYDRRDRKSITDLTIEGEDSYQNDFRNNPSYLQRDFFVVNSQGFSGSMQLYQDQYGVVSRNYSRFQNRDLGIIGLSTERKEVHQWTNVARANVNKQMDIIKLLKKSDQEGDKDFDNTIFVERELLSLTTTDHKFDNPAKFKMRGDLAGEFNLSSANSTDYRPNKYGFVHVSGTGGNSKLSFLKEEKDMPLYYAKPQESTSRNYTNAGNQIRTSSNITYRTLAQVMSDHNGAPATEDNFAVSDPLTNGTATAAQKNKFNDSYLSHQEIGVATNPWDSLTLADSKLQNFNILKSLSDMRAGAPYMDNLIADIRVENAEGLTYVYNLPAFNQVTKNLYLNGKGKLAPVANGTTDYSSFSEGGGYTDRSKTKTTEEFKYPYAWLLTAVVGPDYIDFDDVPGPSEGDLGYWVKFKYVRVAKNYRWRTPFSGLAYNPRATHTNDDDVYMVSTGTKEIYYVSEIESANYVSRYVYQKRFDGLDAKGTDLWNGRAYHALSQNKPVETDPVGTNSQYAVTRVELYKKHYEGDHSGKRLVANKRGKLLRATEFKYDYSVCPQTPNNLINYAPGHASPGVGNYDIKIAKVPYHVKNTTNPTNQIESGKLTLRKVKHLSYESGSEIALPGYDFVYGFDGKTAAQAADSYNPSYDNEQIDQWGNFAHDARLTVSNVTAEVPGRSRTNGIRNPADATGPATINYYNAYPEIDKSRADANAQAFKLAKVLLPGGGSLSVDFEANAYGKVQNQTPFAMRKIRKDVPQSVEAGTNHRLIKLTVDVTDLVADGKNLNDLIKVNDELYGELAFYESNSTAFPRREDQVFVSKESGLVNTIDAALVTFPDAPGRTFQAVFLRDKEKPRTNYCFASAHRRYLYGESDKMRAVKEGFTDINEALYRYETLEKDGPLTAVRKVIGNVKKYFTSDNTFKNQFTALFGDASALVFSHQSYLRTPVYKAKYTGSRVKRMAFSDNFQYATSGTTASPTVSTRENNYVTNYFYDELGDGTGISEGVATIEPGGGKSCVIDLENKKGVGFFPSPSIMSAKTTVETGYGALSTTTGARISRKKGKIAYHFYTPKDQDYQFDSNFQDGGKVPQLGKPDGRFFLLGIISWLIIKFRIFGKRFTIQIPIPLPLAVRWRRHDHYHLRSYAYTDMTDMYGKPKKVVQLSSEGKEVSRSEFNYAGKNETVNVYDGSVGGLAANPFGAAPLQGKPGRMDQVWSEAHYTKESKIHLIPWILLMNANTQRNFSYTNMKYTYVPPLLKGVTNINSVDGTSTTASYESYDYYTGQPLETRDKDSYGNVKIQRVMPAYWKYPEMGPSSISDNKMNMLTQATATYQYLNSVSNSTLLGVGIVEWSKDFLKMNSAVRNKGKVYPTATEFNYDYELMQSDVLEKMYNLNGKTRASLPQATQDKILNNSLPSAAWVYKPYRTYTYEVDLNTNGTFKSFADYIYSSNMGQTQDAKWKQTSTNTLFDMYGNVVESKDILDKYASAHFGYNFAQATTSVGNAPWTGAAYAGAENRYQAGSTTYLDDYRVALTDAEVTPTCANAFAPKTLSYASLTSGNLAKVLNVCVPATLTAANLNVPFARLNVSYANSLGKTMVRSLYVRMNENREFKIITDRGESFKGFYVLPGATGSGCGASYKLAFDGNVFASPVLDNTVTAPGYTVTLGNEDLSACDVNAKSYALPDNDCAGEAHTGKNAFILRGGPGKKGTVFEVVTANLPATEQGRRYKAMVWVHKASPGQTALVVDNGSGTVIKQVSKADAYVTAGNWSLLRLDVTPAEYGAATRLVFSVQNTSNGGAALYDDFRVLPYQGTMANYVYDHATGRVSAKLDNENFATYYLYDGRGRLIEVKSEIENLGPTTIKKYLYNEQKAIN